MASFDRFSFGRAATRRAITKGDSGTENGNDIENWHPELDQVDEISELASDELSSAVSLTGAEVIDTSGTHNRLV